MGRYINMLVDSHCHLNCLDLTKYNGQLDLAIKAAYADEVTHILCVCIDLEHFNEVLTIAEQYENIKASLGVHPTEKISSEPSLEQLIKLADHHNVVAIGETGLDYYHCQGDLTWQQERFRRHIRVAKILKKPLIIHSRQAPEDTIKILREEKAYEVGGVMHCFTESLEMAQQAMELNFYISFSGIVTFKNATKLQDVATNVPLDRLLIETDAPYLAPVPYRGKPNEPAYVKYVAEKIAELKKLDFALVATQTTNNYFSMIKAK